MIHKGQIVEIPANSPLYQKVQPELGSKKEELLWKSQKIEYSLFDGFLIGEHLGTENFKLGQRKGINAGGKKSPLYVIGIDETENRLFVGASENHPGLWVSVLAFPENQMDWQGETHFSKESKENGIAVEITSSILINKAKAILYVFDNEAFLEFGQAVSIAIQDYPLIIIYLNNSIANKK